MERIVKEYYNNNMSLFIKLSTLQNTDEVVNLFPHCKSFEKSDIQVVQDGEKSFFLIDENEEEREFLGTLIIILKDGTKLFHSFYFHTSFFFLEDGSYLNVD